MSDGSVMQGSPGGEAAVARGRPALGLQGTHLGLTARSWKVIPEGHFWSLSFPKAAYEPMPSGSSARPGTNLIWRSGSLWPAQPATLDHNPALEGRKGTVLRRGQSGVL